jgi:hypothetical protein
MWGESAVAFPGVRAYSGDQLRASLGTNPRTYTAARPASSLVSTGLMAVIVLAAVGFLSHETWRSGSELAEAQDNPYKDNAWCFVGPRQVPPAGDEVATDNPCLDADAAWESPTGERGTCHADENNAPTVLAFCARPEEVPEASWAWCDEVAAAVTDAAAVADAAAAAEDPPCGHVFHVFSAPSNYSTVGIHFVNGTEAARLVKFGWLAVLIPLVWLMVMCGQLLGQPSSVRRQGKMLILRYTLVRRRLEEEEEEEEEEKEDDHTFLTRGLPPTYTHACTRRAQPASLWRRWRCSTLSHRGTTAPTSSSSRYDWSYCRTCKATVVVSRRHNTHTVVVAWWG